MENKSYSDGNVMQFWLLTTETVIKSTAYNIILDFTSHIMKKKPQFRYKSYYVSIDFSLIFYKPQLALIYSM